MDNNDFWLKLNNSERAKAHFVLIPKERDFFRYGQNLKNIIIQISKELGVNIISGRINKEYLHLNISYPAKYPLESLVNIIRNNSSKKLLDALSKFGQKVEIENIWEDDYFITSIDGSEKEVQVRINQYLEIVKQPDLKKETKEKFKCLVTGGAGFIGSNLVDELIRLGHEVVIIDDLSTGKAEYINSQARFYRIDISDQEKTEAVFKQETEAGAIDYLFHLAAQMDVRISVSNPALDNRINIIGGINVLESARKYKVKKIIFSSSGGAIYGDTKNIPTPETEKAYPVSPYGINKLAIEKYLNYLFQIYGQDYTILRFANVYGPRQYKGGEAGVVTIFVDNAVKNKPSVINGDGKQTRDFAYVGDVVCSLILAMSTPYRGEVNIGTSLEKNLLEIVRLIDKAMGKKIEVTHGPAKEGEQLRSCLSIERAKMILGWQPEIGLEEGIKRTIAWSIKNAGLDNQYLPKKKSEQILITGSAGFIGFHLAHRLLKNGLKVVGVDNFNDYYDPNLKEDRNKILESYPNYKLYRGDLADLNLVKQIFAENNIFRICHLAAQAGVRYSAINPHAYIQSNLVGFTNLIEEAKNAKIDKFVFASSSSVYGKNAKIPFSKNDRTDQPISLYGATKKANELIAHSYNHLFGLKCVGLRFFTVYGPWGRPDMAYFKFADLMRQGKPIDIYNFGKMKRDFTYIDDIVDGIISALEKDIDFEILNLGHDQPEELENFVVLLEKHLGIKAVKNYLPLQPGESIINWADINESRQLLGFSPKIEIEEGIKKFTDWYKSYYRVNI